jgi:hypothetical protein
MGTKTEIQRIQVLHPVGNSVDTIVCNPLAIAQAQVIQSRHILGNAKKECVCQLVAFTDDQASQILHRPQRNCSVVEKGLATPKIQQYKFSARCTSAAVWKAQMTQSGATPKSQLREMCTFLGNHVNAEVGKKKIVSGIERTQLGQVFTNCDCTQVSNRDIRNLKYTQIEASRAD